MARAAADLAKVKAERTPGPTQVGLWLGAELRAFRIEDSATLKSLESADVPLVTEPGRDGPRAGLGLGASS